MFHINSTYVSIKKYIFHDAQSLILILILSEKIVVSSYENEFVSVDCVIDLII
jgi:hypothetical protein